VTFPTPPVFSSAQPFVLRQTVPTDVIVAPSYNLSFWVSGEENSTNQGNTGAGIIGMRLTNVLPGDPVQWLAVPNSIQYGMSILYEYTFTPINPGVPVEIRFINPGTMNLQPHGGSQFGTKPILDDVIINAVVPEPGTLALLAGAAIAVLRRRRMPSFPSPALRSSEGPGSQNHMRLPVWC
jgi:hypothetical protein